MNKVIVNALRAFYIGEIEKAKANVNIFLTNSVGVGEHPDVLDSVTQNIERIAQFEDNLSVLDKHFNQEPIKI
tara:strand:+ start:39 stop:257 length:219 start_codon:yes stop_codon:yes gene_type:complete